MEKFEFKLKEFFKQTYFYKIIFKYFLNFLDFAIRIILLILHIFHYGFMFKDYFIIDFLKHFFSLNQYFTKIYQIFIKI